MSISFQNTRPVAIGSSNPLATASLSSVKSVSDRPVSPQITPLQSSSIAAFFAMSLAVWWVVATRLTNLAVQPSNPMRTLKLHEGCVMQFDPAVFMHWFASRTDQPLTVAVIDSRNKRVRSVFELPRDGEIEIALDKNAVPLRDLPKALSLVCSSEDTLCVNKRNASLLLVPKGSTAGASYVLFAVGIPIAKGEEVFLPLEVLGHRVDNC